MDETNFRRWAQGFRAEAAADKYRIAMAGWERGSASVVGETDPIQKRHARNLVRDTVQFVALVLAYYGIDGTEGAERFLQLQTYDPTASQGRYLLIFEMGKYRRTQLVVDELRDIDLVDLHEATGFDILVILHCDGSEFEPGEHDELRKEVLADVRYDFSEEEMPLEFNEFPTGLQVWLPQLRRGQTPKGSGE